MIPSYLAASQGIKPAAKPKARLTFKSPKTGKVYEWTKQTDPTPADIKSLIALDDELASGLDLAKKVSRSVDAAKARMPKKPDPTPAEVLGQGLRGMAKDISGALGPIQSTARDAVLLGPAPFVANALTGRKPPSIKDVLPKEASPILDALVPSSVVTDPIDVAGQFLVDPKQAAYDQFGKAFDPNAPVLDRFLTGLNIAGLIPGAFGAVKGVQKIAKGIRKGAKAVGVVDEAAELAAKKLLRNPADGEDLAPSFRPVRDDLTVPEVRIRGVAQLENAEPRISPPVEGLKLTGNEIPDPSTPKIVPTPAVKIDPTQTMRPLPAPSELVIPVVPDNVRAARIQNELSEYRQKFGESAPVTPDRVSVDAFIEANYMTRQQGLLNAVQNSSTGDFSKALGGAGIKEAKAARSKLLSELKRDTEAGRVHPQVKQELTDLWENANRKPEPPVVPAPKVARVKARTVAAPDPLAGLSPEELAAQKIVPTRGVPTTVAAVESPAAAPTPKPAVSMTAPVEPMPTPTRFAASNAASEGLRADIGLNALPEPTRRKWETVLEDAKKTYNADEIDARIADTKNPLSDTETAQAAIRSAELREALRTAKPEAYDGIEKKLIDHTIALRDAGTEQGRALAARNMAVLNDYSLDGMYRRYAGASKAKSADDISSETRQKIKQLSEEREAVILERDKLKAELDAKRAELAQKAVQGELGAARSRRVKPGDPARKKQLITSILDRQKQYISSVPGQFLIDAAPEIKELARIKIAEGLDKLDDIRAAVLADLNGAGIDIDGGQFDAVLAGEFNSKLAKLQLSAYQQAVAEAKAARKASDAGRIARAESRLKLLEDRLQERLDRQLSKTKTGKDLLDAEKKVKVREIELDKIVNDAKAAKEWEAMPKGMKVLTNVMGISRGLVLGADAGSVLNQGLFGLLARPFSAADAVKQGLKSIKSEKALTEVLAAARANPKFDRAVAAGLDVKAALGNFENEFYNSAAVNKLPGYKQGSRFYDGQMTALRMNMFESYVDSLARMKSNKYTGGKSGALTDEDYQLLAELVNTATGVGTGQVAAGLKSANKKLNVLLAPGYRVSRIKLAAMTPFFNAVAKKNYRVASIILSDYVRFLGLLAGAAYGIKRMGGDIELDPRSTDFMKYRDGNVSISLASGVEAPIKQIVQMLAGKIPSRMEGEENQKPNTSQSGPDSFVKWMVSSISPFYQNSYILLSQAMQRALAEPGDELKFKYFGKNVDALDQEGQKNLLKMQMPLFTQQIWDLIKDADDDVKQKYLYMAGSIFGSPVNVKERKQ